MAASTQVRWAGGKALPTRSRALASALLVLELQACGKFDLLLRSYQKKK